MNASFNADHKKEPLLYLADSGHTFAIGRDTFELVWWPRR
jgi:hypothetical protein